MYGDTMQVIEFSVPAVPVAQPRPRATLAHGGMGARIHEVTHIKQADGTRKPHPIAAFKATVRMAFQDMHKGPPLAGPLRVDVVAVFPRPQRLIWKTRPMPRAWHVATPDRDNLDKAILDSLKELAWNDDCQVCDGQIQKWYAAGDEAAHVRITITELAI